MFSDAARTVMQAAKSEAVRLKHDHIATEHLLLGILGHANNKAKDIMVNAMVDLDKLKKFIEETTTPPCGQTSIPKDLPLLANAKRTLEFSGLEARFFRSQSIEPEHILLALLKDVECVAAQALAAQDFGYREAYEELLMINSGDAGGKYENQIEIPISETVRDILSQAQADAARLGNSETLICHFLRSLLNFKADPAVSRLTNAGVDIQTLKKQLETIAILTDDPFRLRLDLAKLKIVIRRTPRTLNCVPMSRLAKLALVSACYEAQINDREIVDTTCLLLAMLNDATGEVTQVLAKYNLRYETLKAQLGQAK